MTAHETMAEHLPGALREWADEIEGNLNAHDVAPGENLAFRLVTSVYEFAYHQGHSDGACEVGAEYQDRVRTMRAEIDKLTVQAVADAAAGQGHLFPAGEEKT